MKFNREDIAIIENALACKMNDIDKAITINTRLFTVNARNGLYTGVWEDKLERLKEKRAKVQLVQLKIARFKKA